MTLSLSVSICLGSFLFFLEQFLFLEVVLALKEGAQLGLGVLEVGLGPQPVGHNSSFVIDLGRNVLAVDLTSIFLLVIGEDLDLNEILRKRAV